MKNNYLQALEDESIYIIRETFGEFKNPVLFYSIGKDSTVLLHLIMKAFYPAKPPLQLLHIDTGWEFKEMGQFRDALMKKLGLDIIVHINPRGTQENITPFIGKSYTDIMKTDALKDALNKYKFDAAFGGARRDEEKSRAKERVFSFRNRLNAWDPKNQRPELFNLFNCKINQGESMRVFPLSNWTELDIWNYIRSENINVVPLYFAKERPVIERDGMIIMVDDARMELKKGEKPVMKKVRFRTLGCYPLTGAVASEADDIDKVIAEMEVNKFSERQGRMIDRDQVGSMEKKKLEGYF